MQLNLRKEWYARLQCALYIHTYVLLLKHLLSKIIETIDKKGHSMEYANDCRKKRIWTVQRKKKTKSRMTLYKQLCDISRPLKCSVCKCKSKKRTKMPLSTRSPLIISIDRKTVREKFIEWNVEWLNILLALHRYYTFLWKFAVVMVWITFMHGKRVWLSLLCMNCHRNRSLFHLALWIAYHRI